MRNVDAKIASSETFDGDKKRLQLVMSSHDGGGIMGRLHARFKLSDFAAENAFLS